MFDHASLAAVAAVIRTGSFEKAAQQLHVTPSAVSQRVKTLEDRLGAVLIIRGQPCSATIAGTRLCRHASDVGLLEHALQADLQGLIVESRPTTLRVAVNADSLATWFIGAMAGTEGFLFDLVLDDQDHSADWLRRGEVSAAVTAIGGGVQGCGSKRLGALRYVATASPGFMERWFPAGVNATSLKNAPCLRFNAKDELQERWMFDVTGKRIAAPNHFLPSAQAFLDGALAGLGWGMNPETWVRDHLAEKRLVALLPDRMLDVQLYWQWSRAIEVALAGVTDAVVNAAGKYLIQ